MRLLQNIGNTLDISDVLYHNIACSISWMTKVKIVKTYLAGPMAFVSDTEMHGWRDRIKQLAESSSPHTFEWRDPTRRLFKNGKMTFRDAYDIVTCDKVDIHYCDYLIADFRELAKKTIMIGTTQENIYAFENGKFVISIVSPEVSLSPWTNVHSHQVVNTEEDAVMTLLAEVNGVREYHE